MHRENPGKRLNVNKRLHGENFNQTHFQMISVKQGINSAVDVRQYDAEESNRLIDKALFAESVNTIDRIQRNPTNHEESHDD